MAAWRAAAAGISAMCTPGLVTKMSSTRNDKIPKILPWRSASFADTRQMIRQCKRPQASRSRESMVDAVQRLCEVDESNTNTAPQAEVITTGSENDQTLITAQSSFMARCASGKSGLTAG
jgi:hypothetical protein